MTEAVVGLGSNLGDRLNYLRQALEMLSALPETRLVKASSIIETQPVDVPSEYENVKFFNQVAIFETNLPVNEFSKRMHSVEDALGRVRTVKNGPRTVDIDLIDFGGIVMNTPELVLPHPRAALRDFVVRPLQELGFDIQRLK